MEWVGRLSCEMNGVGPVPQPVIVEGEALQSSAQTTAASDYVADGEFWHSAPVGIVGDDDGSRADLNHGALPDAGRRATGWFGARLRVGPDGGDLLRQELHAEPELGPQRSSEVALKPTVKINSGGPAFLLSGCFLLVRCGFKIYYPEPEPEAGQNDGVARCLVLGICFVMAGTGIILQQIKCPAGFYSAQTPRQAEASRAARLAGRM
eukprot:SAG22_NODE_5511_length_1002_cov_0.857143_1_plen_208_part_00